MRTCIRLSMLTALVALVAALAAPPLLARQGAYVGLGGARQSVDGDLDGSTVATDTSVDRSLRLPSLDPGAGVTMEAGYGLTPYFAMEFIYVSTAHKGTFTDAGGTTADHDARLNSFLVGGRANFPTSEAFELFARVGLGGYTLRVEDNAFTAGNATPVGSPALGTSRATGNGAYYGIGVAMTGEKVGFELASIYQQATFDRFSEGPVNGDLDPAVDATIVTHMLLLTYHFN